MTPLLWRDAHLGSWTDLALSVHLEDRLQTSKWGTQEHTPAEWSVIISEEVGELMKELCEAHFQGVDLPRAKRIWSESIQAATLLLKVAEMAYPLGGPP